MVSWGVASPTDFNGAKHPCMWMETVSTPPANDVT